jgi:flavin reductase (DIM6/NTAB) family NADH-FMN oxidoreductase RutF
MTMSSFTSLALQPTPAVTFNVATPSRTLDAIRASRKFNIHILSGDTSGAKVADWFTRGNSEDGHAAFQDLDTESGVQMVNPETTSPPMLDGPGILYIIRCSLMDEPLGGIVSVRDHAIVLGEVLEIIEGSGREARLRAGTTDTFGLLHADRRFRQLGNALIKLEGNGNTN